MNTEVSNPNKIVLEAINREFGVDIEVNAKNIGIIEDIISDKLNELAEGSDLGDCSNCDMRRGEPRINEGYL